MLNTMWSYLKSIDAVNRLRFITCKVSLWHGCWSPGSWRRQGTRDPFHYDDVIMGAMASQITSPAIVYSTVYSDADQRKHQNSVSLAFVRGIHRRPVNFPHNGQKRGKFFHFMTSSCYKHNFTEIKAGISNHAHFYVECKYSAMT